MSLQVIQESGLIILWPGLGKGYSRARTRDIPGESYEVCVVYSITLIKDIPG